LKKKKDVDFGGALVYYLLASNEVIFEPAGA
jgi:hypothetical protein